MSRKRQQHLPSGKNPSPKPRPMTSADKRAIILMLEESARMAARMLPGNRAYSAEDAVQDLAVILIEQDLTSKVVPHRGTLEMLRVGVLRNICRSAKRKFHNPREVPLKDEACHEFPETPDHVMARELRTVVRQAVKELPPHMRRAIYDKFGPMDDDDMPPPARTSGTSTPSVHRNRAKKRLHVLLHDLWPKVAV
jgi:DNA-directed RNA polymerase specialized sigma24 family protein